MILHVLSIWNRTFLPLSRPTRTQNRLLIGKTILCLLLVPLANLHADETSWVSGETETPMYASATEQNAIIASIPRGLMIRRLESSTEGTPASWAQIEYSGIVGWISESAISETPIEPLEDGLYLLAGIPAEWMALDRIDERWVVFDRCGPGTYRLIIDGAEPLYPESILYTDYSGEYFTIKSVHQVGYREYEIVLYNRDLGGRYNTRLLLAGAVSDSENDAGSDDDSGVTIWENFENNGEERAFASLEHASEFPYIFERCE
jgi:hypothetical protein